MSVDVRRFVTVTGWCAAGALIALAAPTTALAEPAPPPPPPGPLMLQPPPPAPAPPPPAAPIVNAAAPAPQAPAGEVPAPAAVPPDGTPHLPSPDALPVGTTMDPAAAGNNESPNTSYLRDLWQAVQNQEISGKEALILGLSQRGMNTPIPQQAPGPNVPIQYPRDPAPAPPLDPALPPPPPAPALPPPPAPPLPTP